MNDLSVVTVNVMHGDEPIISRQRYSVLYRSDYRTRFASADQIGFSGAQNIGLLAELLKTRLSSLFRTTSAIISSSFVAVLIVFVASVPQSIFLL